ncbi:MAG: T9SS type A sorting domain-containing protein [Phaeodactylibacter xiamenensis]
MNGRIVKSFEHLGSSGFDVSDLTNGLYIVSIWEDGKRLLTTKLSVVK